MPEAEEPAEHLVIPPHTKGLHILYEPPATVQVQADVVAVHGLGGDSFSTWTEKASGTLWLQHLLPQSKVFYQTRIMTFGYDARKWLTPADKTTPKRLFTFAEELLVALRNKRLLANAWGRPIIYIGHSLGGIVIKKALVLAHSRQTLYGDIYESSKFITFLGTPHHGADIAAWARYLGKISKVVGVQNSKAVRDLETWSEALLDLSREFCQQLTRLKVTSFYEQEPYKGIFVVREGSAVLNHDGEVVLGLTANHTSICKFPSKDCPIYGTVLENLEARMVEMELVPLSRQQVTQATRPLIGAPSASGGSLGETQASTTSEMSVEETPQIAYPDAPTTQLDVVGGEGEGDGDDDLEDLRRRFVSLKSETL